MALRHAILSALSRGAALSGYKLNSVFADQNERVWHASPSQVYSDLNKLENESLIAVAERNKRGHTLYVITPAGTEELRRWLTFTEPDHTIRDDSLLRLMTLWILDETTARHLVEAEIAFQRKRRTQLALKIAEYTDTFGDAPVWRNRLAVHYLWLAQTDLLIGWLERLPSIISASEPSVGESLADLSALTAAAVS